MRTAYAKPCQRTQDGFPTGGFTLSKIGAGDAGQHRQQGSPGVRKTHAGKYRE
jgi:hypothetical protein